MWRIGPLGPGHPVMQRLCNPAGAVPT